MTQSKIKAKVEGMLGLKLTVGQVISSFVVVIPMTIGSITYLNTNYETKDDAKATAHRLEKRIEVVEQNNAEAQKIQTQIFGDVKRIAGILEAQWNQQKK